jgi:hypothetical protein
MPLQKIQFRPGLNREGTDYSNEGGWYDGDKIRFRSGFPEKIGGWVKQSINTFIGAARSLWNWVDLANQTYIGVGTNKKFYIENGGAFYDVTPIYHTSTLAIGAISTAYSTLNGGITATSTSITLTSGASFPNSGVIKIGTEQIYYASKSTNVLSQLIRGYNGTTAALHATASPVGCSSIVITDAGYAPNLGDYINFPTSFTLGALTISGEYTVTTLEPSNKYTITASGFSTSLATNAATVTTQYEYPIGLNIENSGNGGWGSSYWGSGSWGISGSGGASQQLRLWTQDNFGQQLFLAPRGGPVYYWIPAGGGNYPDGTTPGVSTRAQSLQTQSTAAGYSGTYVPNTTNQVISSAIQRFVITFGANSYVSGSPNTTFNPMLVRWSDQGNPYQWVPDVTNQSGEFALTNGSYIMGARATRQEILVWTDSAIYSMQYLGAPYVWGFQILMDNISVTSPNSMVTVNNVTYWMGVEKFYMYSGRVETLPCSLRQYIFDNINQDQSYQIFAGANEAYNEVWWYYCSKNSTTIDSYVIYNYLDRVWYYGTLSRTAWLETGILNYPVAAQYNAATDTGTLLYHEVGVDDGSGATTLPIDAYVQSSDFDIGDGHNFGFVWRILPDVNFNGSNVNNPSVTMTIRPRVNSGTPYGVADNPQVQSAQNYSNVSVYNVQQFDGQVYTRLRGRQLAFRIESKGLGVAWQLGSPRMDIRPDGRR